MTATIDEVAKTLGEFEALAQKTGEWDGADPVEFSPDGVAWSTVWAQEEFPTFARATVYRKGVARATVILVAWAESLPADDEWRALWERKPMKLFGSFALRSGIRHAFRDAVGDLRGPDEDLGDPWAPAAEPRDWVAELAETLTPDAVLDLHAAAKTARAMTPQLESAFRKRLAEVRAASTRLLNAVAETVPDLTPEEAIRAAAFFDQPATPVARVTPATILHAPKPAETRKPRRAQSQPHETAVQTALRDAVLRVTKADA